MTILSREELFRQVSFIGYYFHWSKDQILGMPNLERIRFCEEISRINRKANGGKNLFEP